MSDENKAKDTKEVAVKEEQKVIVKDKKVTDYSLGIFGTEDNFIMATQMAKALAESTIVPQTYQKNWSNCLIAIEQAQRLKVSPMMVMQNLYVIQGRPSWSSSFLIAAINNSHIYDTELQFEETKDKNGKPYSCLAFALKSGRRVEGMEITMDMAQAEGWLNKNGSKWKTMPQLMLRYRAASFFARLNCPEITLGLYTQDEVIDGDFKEYPMPDPKSQMKADVEAYANSVPFEEQEVESVRVDGGGQTSFVTED